MTATDELRRMLDERGVKWGTGFGGDTFWTGRHGIEWRWDKQEGALAMWTHAITPEQAIEATLGRGTCEMEYVSDFMSWHCKACGQMDMAPRNPKPRYCKWCGAKVVDDASVD